ncbi:hypothetical protein GPALN_005125 [Globodera pallida]|nr:hypothetical protein GPALN_005125 [Globodera pallida]
MAFRGMKLWAEGLGSISPPIVCCAVLCLFDIGCGGDKKWHQNVGDEPSERRKLRKAHSLKPQKVANCFPIAPAGLPPHSALHYDDGAPFDARLIPVGATTTWMINNVFRDDEKCSSPFSPKRRCVRMYETSSFATTHTLMCPEGQQINLLVVPMRGLNLDLASGTSSVLLLRVLLLLLVVIDSLLVDGLATILPTPVD